MLKFYLPLYENDKLSSYKEFNDIIDVAEYIPVYSGTPLQHQEIISNIMSGSSPINNLLLVHDMGTGKTCTSIYAIEKNIRDNIYGMKQALILNRGKAIMNNFINELVNKCTVNYRGSKKLWSKFYTFETFEIFSKKIKAMSDETIKRKYNNTFVVIDEVHNIINEESETYNNISRFLSLLCNKKLLLLTGTPVKDTPENVIPILNLLFDKQEDKFVSKTFFQTYYDSLGNLTTSFKNKLMGKISYLKSSESEIPVDYKGKLHFDLKKFKSVVHYMSLHQSTHYLKAFKKDSYEKGIYTNSKQAVRFVFPNGSYGNDGFNTYISEKSKKYKLKDTFKTELIKYGSDVESILKRIKDCSVKYEYIIRKILEAESRGEKSLVYDDLIRGSGLILFSLLLNFIGFTKYRLLTSETSLSEISSIQKKFNEDIFGETISVILGSKVISEGFTFTDVMHEHIVPHWNNTETMQVVARGIRLGSHNKILQHRPDSFVTVYRHITVSTKKDYHKSIDYLMFKTSENKELEIDKILNVFKEIAVTCNSFIERNGGGKCLDPSPPGELVKENFFSNTFTETEKNFTVVKNFFKNIYCSHILEIQKMTGIEIITLLNTLEILIAKKEFIINDKGVKCFLNENNNFFFLTEDIRKENDIRMSFYTNELKPWTTMTDTEEYLHAIEIATGNKISTLRQVEIAVTSKMLHKDTELCNKILNDNEGIWHITKDEKTGAVWDPEDNKYMRCLNDPEAQEPWKNWKKCGKQSKITVIQDLSEKTVNIEKEFKNISSYYGLRNDYLNEFCIKKISDETDQTIELDRRKIASGKRCTNWTKKDLRKVSDNLNITWSENESRGVICKNIHDKMKTLNLVVKNRSCGVQTKRK
nr:MAG: DEAD-like helicase [Diabrotica toursvirus 3a]